MKAFIQPCVSLEQKLLLPFPSDVRCCDDEKSKEKHVTERLVQTFSWTDLTAVTAASPLVGQDYYRFLRGKQEARYLIQDLEQTDSGKRLEIQSMISAVDIAVLKISD